MLPHEQDNGEAESQENASLTLSFVPNPTSGAGTLEAAVHNPGRLEVALYDISGTKVDDLPSLDVEQPGAYRLKFNTESLPNGTYLIVATINGHRSTIQIQVAR